MSSLSKCIERAGKLISPIEAKVLLRSAERYREEGFGALEANVGAVEDVIQDLRADLRSIAEQIRPTLGAPAEGAEFSQKFGTKADLASKLIGILTREYPEIQSRAKLAAFIAEFAPKAKPFSESLFGILSYAVDVDQTGSAADWKGLYEGIDSGASSAEDGGNERGEVRPETNSPGDAGSEPGAEGAGDRGGMGGEQPASGSGVGGGGESASPGQGGAGTGGRRPRAGKGRRDDASRGSRDLPDVRRTAPGSGAVATENYRITEEDRIGEGGLKTKYADNIAAIRALKQIEADGRQATVAEQQILVRYVGWGGLKAVFNPENKEWAREYRELKELLTSDEYAAARRSVLNAHYTSPTVVRRGVYAALLRFGFRGGNMIEGGVGTGHFIGMMPDEMRGNTSYVGVERDSVTARIAQRLYPQAKIHEMSFEAANLAPGSFDASAGNPPFGDTSVHDKNFKEASRFSLHNYFILKQLELLKPGGVAGFVVSHYFLDAQDPSARQAIAGKAEFLGAIRLPNTAFKQNANTEVTTDIVFFRKLPEGVEASDQSWVGTAEISEKSSGKPITVNAWLSTRPEMMLGEMTLEGKMYGGEEATLSPRPNQDLGADLDAAVQQLPEGVYETVDAETKRRLTTPETVVPDGAKIGGYFIDSKGQLMRRGPDVNMERTSVPMTDLKEGVADRIKGIVAVRDALNQLVKAEFSDETTDRDLAKLRKDLNRAYDAFVQKFGYLNQQANRRAFFEDPEAARVLGLESEFDPGISAAVAKKREIAPRQPSAKKAAIFMRRVNQPYTEITKVETPKEALAVSLNQRGEVDPAYMAEITGMDAKGVLDALKGLVFQTPSGAWQSKEQYLSGDVRRKLREAEEAFAQTQDPQWKENADALRAVIPADIHPVDIAVPVGAPWVPAEDVAQFAREITERGPDYVVYRKSDGGWLFEHNDNSTASTQKWGTERAPFGDIFVNLLNGKPTVIYDRLDDDKRVVNAEQTALAQAKGEEIKAKWEDWIWSDPDRRTRLARFYNDNFNSYVDPKYDGSHLTLPGASSLVQLRPHQKNVIWRTITDRRSLYDHVVGAGKTFAGIASFMEMRRLGRVRKPLFVVPNHLTRQWRDEFVKLYPNANVLYTGPSDFEKANRQKLFAKILTGEFDAVIVGHSQFKKLGVSSAVERDLLNEMLQEISEAIEAMKAAEGKRRNRSRAVAQAEKTKEKIQAKLAALADVGKRDDVATFEELGIDGLFVDEAHEFKNLFYTTQMQNVAGLGDPAGSAKAFDLYLKTRYMHRRFGGKAPLVFATGTPISNSLVEMFTMQRYLQPDVLDSMGLKTLDAWARVFGSVRHVYEVDPTGTGYRMATRLAEFQNVGELASVYRTVADVITMTDLQEQAEMEGKRFPVPKVKGGKPTNYAVERTAEQRDYFGVETQEMDTWQKYGYSSEDEAIRAGWKPTPLFDSSGNPLMTYPAGTILWRVDNMPKDPTIDNMLKLTNDARKAGLDMRLVDPNAPDRPESKVNKAVGEILRVYRQWEADKGTQLVFCDLSVPASARGQATKKAREQAGEFFFVRDAAGAVVPVENASPVEIPGAEGFEFFIRKSDATGNWVVTERSSGRTLVSAGTRKAALDEAAQRFAGVKDRFRDLINQNLPAAEQVVAARQEWEANRMKPDAEDTASDETTPTDGEQGASVDELLADQSQFSVYDDMRAKLVKAGVPANEIAFIHDFNTPEKKQKLFDAMNRGDVRVLFGSTPKLGAGTNVQQRLVALHHLDAPWRPSDLEQREGRIVRQGNRLYERDPEGFEVELMRYATKQTYDTRMWQLIEHKARGIEGFRRADRSTRRIEDVSGEAANASDMKAAASGDPLIQQELELRNDRNKLELLRRAWTRNRIELQGLVAWHEGAELRKNSSIAAAQKVIDARKPKPDPFEFTTADGKKLTEKKGIAEIVANAARKVKEARESSKYGTEAVVGVYRGYEFSLGMSERFLMVYARGTGVSGTSPISSYDKDDTISDTGFIQRLDNFLDGFDRDVERANVTFEMEQRRLAELQDELAKPFAREAEFTKAVSEHEAVRQQLLARRSANKGAAQQNPPSDQTMGTPPDQQDSDMLGTPPVQGSPAQEAVLAKVNGTLEDKRTLLQKLQDYLADLRDYIAIELKQKLLDQFASIKRLERQNYGANTFVDANSSAYKAARLTKNLPSVMEYLMRHGQLVYQAGSFKMKQGGKGLLEIFKPLIDAGTLRLWEGYVTAFRANRLLAEGKETNFGRTWDPAAGKWNWDRATAQREINELLALATQYPEFESVRRQYADFQKGIVDVAEAAGLVSADQRAIWEKSDYVPFYRITEQLDGRGPRKRRGIADQRSGIHKLKGAAAPVAIMENIVRNVETMVDASFKNIAMQRVADLADNNRDMLVKIPYKAVPFKASVEEVMEKLEEAGVDTSGLTTDEAAEFVKFWRMRAPKGKDVVSVMVNGKPIYYRVKDQALLRSVQSMGPRVYSWWMKALMAPKTALTSLVTLDPAFMAANTIRDSFSAWVISDTPIRPGIDSAIGFVKSLRNDPTKLAVMAAGGGTGHYNNLRGGNIRDYIRQMTPAQRKTFFESIIDSPKKLARLYTDLGRATENANRLAIAESVLKRGGTEAEAAFQALDIMDFGLRGDSALLNFFLDTVPFLNARIQGLYRLGRGLKEDPKRVATHGAVIIGATFALLASNWDDDRYWELPEWERDIYYHFWLGDQHIRIPKPFEVGQIFSTIPERFFEFMAKTGDGELLAKRMLSMLAETFAMNPLPQAIRPAAERAMNINTFTGRPIISRGDEFKMPEQQFNPLTSETMRELAQVMPEITTGFRPIDAANEWMRSPKTLEHFVRGYFGSIGMYALTGADAMTRAATDAPADPEVAPGDWWVMKRFAPSSDTRETKYVQQFYDLHREITTLVRQIKELQKTDPAAAREVQAENADLLGYASRAETSYDIMQALRKQERGIYESRNEDPEEKRRRLAALAARRNAVARSTMEAAPRRTSPIYNPFN